MDYSREEKFFGESVRSKNELDVLGCFRVVPHLLEMEEKLNKIMHGLEEACKKKEIMVCEDIMSILISWVNEYIATKEMIEIQ